MNKNLLRFIMLLMGVSMIMPAWNAVSGFLYFDVWPVKKIKGVISEVKIEPPSEGGYYECKIVFVNDTRKDSLSGRFDLESTKPISKGDSTYVVVSTIDKDMFTIESRKSRINTLGGIAFFLSVIIVVSLFIYKSDKNRLSPTSSPVDSPSGLGTDANEVDIFVRRFK